jgi:adenylate kinase family enzyme
MVPTVRHRRRAERDNFAVGKIIHIGGAPGSGKSTLGKLLKKHLGNKVIVVDTDDIMDEVYFKKLVKDKKFQKAIKNCQENKAFKIGDKYNLEYANKIIKYALSEGKPVIFVGITINLLHIANYKFEIDMDFKKLIRQQMLRELEIIHKNYKEIKRLIKTIKNECLLYRILVHKMKLRVGIHPPMFEDMLKNEKSIRNAIKKDGYKFLSPKEIFNRVVKIVENKD